MIYLQHSNPESPKCSETQSFVGPPRQSVTTQLLA